MHFSSYSGITDFQALAILLVSALHGGQSPAFCLCDSQKEEFNVKAGQKLASKK